MRNLSGLERLILLLVFCLVALGFVLLFINKEYFVIYTDEDGFIEWMTVIGLLLGAVVCIYRVVQLYAHKSWLFSLTNIVLALLLIFVAGEEISWGQRIFGIQSSEYFQQHNTQRETNIHNLVVDNMRLNKIIFSFVLIGLLAIYLIIVPIVYRKNKAFQKFVNYAGAVIPQWYQVISFGILFLLTSLIPHDKNAELLEFGAGFIYFLIILFPLNASVFQNQNSIETT